MYVHIIMCGVVNTLLLNQSSVRRGHGCYWVHVH